MYIGLGHTFTRYYNYTSNASGHLGWIAIDRQTGVSASDINMAMSDEYEMHVQHKCPPSTSANFRVRFLNSSAGLIGDSGKYEWKIVEDGTLQSSTEDSMRSIILQLVQVLIMG